MPDSPYTEYAPWLRRIWYTQYEEILRHGVTFVYAVLELPPGRTTPQPGDPVKWGTTKQDPVRRLKDLNTGNWRDLTLHAVLPGDERQERLLQHMWRRHSLRLEWFQWQPEMATLIDDATVALRDASLDACRALHERMKKWEDLENRLLALEEECPPVGELRDELTACWTAFDEEVDRIVSAVDKAHLLIKDWEPVA